MKTLYTKSAIIENEGVAMWPILARILQERICLSRYPEKDA